MYPSYVLMSEKTEFPRRMYAEMGEACHAIGQRLGGVGMDMVISRWLTSWREVMGFRSGRRWS